MKKIIIAFILIAVSPIISFADELILKLKGFQLGQYREVVGNELGSPFKKEKFEDGFEQEIYLLNTDTSVYMIFEYSPANIEVIWSIQLTGNIFETDFKKLNLGMDKSKVIKILGEPSRKKDVGEYGEKWEYDDTNYSIEISTRGKLSSIKITDESYKMFPKVDESKIPVFSNLIDLLKTKSNIKVYEILSPDIEIYLSDSTYFFRNSIINEINHDKSGLFNLIRTLAQNLGNVNTKDINEYEENVRLSRGKNPLHVIKIKNGQLVKEIVFQYRFGKYLIWEIST